MVSQQLIINPSKQEFKSFILSLPDIFNQSGTIVYQGRNILKRFIVENTPLIVKQFKRPHIINRFVYGNFRKTKAMRSFLHAQYLLDKGIETPSPFGSLDLYSCGLNDSYYVSLELQNSREIKEFWLNPEIGDRQWILKEFGRFTGNLHNMNILHKDYSSRNVMFITQENKVTFYLVDLNRMYFDKKISEEQGYKNLERLWLPDEAYDIIARGYAEARNLNTAHAVERIFYYKNRFMNQKK